MSLDCTEISFSGLPRSQGPQCDFKAGGPLLASRHCGGSSGPGSPTLQPGWEVGPGLRLVTGVVVLGEEVGNAPAGLHKSCLEAVVQFYEPWNKAAPSGGHAASVALWKAKLDAAS